jgi:peptide/nickel transport system ATP-binding protein
MNATETVNEPSVDVIDLRIALTGSGVDVVDEIAVQIRPGEVLGLVGESGSGKTTVGMALLGHVRRGGEIVGGVIRIDGRDLSTLSEPELRRLRGGVVSYIPQDPGTSLNPALRISTQLEEILEAHASNGGAEDRRARVREALEEVALPSDDEFLKHYPHQLSGGQQQRVAIAMAFANRPHVIVCDEPTTGLDVTTQARVLETVRDLCRSHRVAALYVSHDLAVVAELADRVAVMYGGRIVESGTRDKLFNDPRHPYTRRLLRECPISPASARWSAFPGTRRCPAAGHRGATSIRAASSRARTAAPSSRGSRTSARATRFAVTTSPTPYASPRQKAPDSPTGTRSARKLSWASGT